MKAVLMHYTPNIIREMFARTRGTTTAAGFDAVYETPWKFLPSKQRAQYEELQDQWLEAARAGRNSNANENALFQELKKYEEECMIKFVTTKALDPLHMSVTRGVTFTFAFEVSRSAGRQMLRHVVGAYWEEFSQRYSKVTTAEYVGNLILATNRLLNTLFDSRVREGGPHIPLNRMSNSMETYEALDELKTILRQGFIIPPHFEKKLETVEQAYMFSKWANVRGSELNQYLDEIDSGVPVEDARENLPNCMITYMECSFTFEALQNFLAKRLCDRAQSPIRSLARVMRKQVLKEVPWLAPYLGIQCSLKGFCPEVNPGKCPLHANNGGRYVSRKDMDSILMDYARSSKQEKSQ